MNRFKKTISSFSFNIISAIVVLLLAFSLIVSSIGYASFTDTLKREYKKTTYHMTEAATSLIDASLIDDYLEGKENEDYKMRYGYLKNYCNYMDVTLIHMFKMDQSDYITGTNIFNVVNNKDIEAGNYSEWELGFVYGERYTKNIKIIIKKYIKKKLNIL